MYTVTIPVICDIAYEHKESTLKELKRGGADRVAIALYRELPYKFSSKETLAHLKELIEYFEANGLETLVWLGETLGHDRYSPAAKTYGYTPVKNAERGEVAAFCPKDEAFIADFASWVKNVAKCGAKLIILDDDFRMGQGFGCWCDLHVAALEKQLNESVEGVALKEYLLKGAKNKYRDAWLKVQGDGLREFASAMRKALNEVNPEIRLGACLTHMNWDADGDPIANAKAFAGNTKPFVRLFGAPYHGGLLGNAIERERTQLQWLKDEGFEAVSEGDTYPRPRFACPASHLECFDEILRADGKADGILKYMIDYASSPEYETGYVDFAEKNAPLYREIESLFRGKADEGVYPYLVKNTIADAELNEYYRDTEDSVAELSFDELSAYTFTNALSLPTCREEGKVKIIFGESARHVLKEQLTCGAILDLVAARILTERGFDVGLKDARLPKFDGEDGLVPLGATAYETYLESGEKVQLGNGTIYDLTLDTAAQVLSRVSYYQDGGKNSFAFTYRYENADGQRFFVVPVVARQVAGQKGFFKSYERKRQVINAVEWLGKKPLPAVVEGNYPMTYSLVKSDGCKISAGLWNLFDDRAEGVRVRLPRKVEEVRFVNCRGHIEGQEVVLDSVLYPYEFAGFEARVQEEK